VLVMRRLGLSNGLGEAVLSKRPTNPFPPTSLQAGMGENGLGRWLLTERIMPVGVGAPRCALGHVPQEALKSGARGVMKRDARGAIGERAELRAHTSRGVVKKQMAVRQTRSENAWLPT
jgi:hypothetical protein